MLHLEDEQPLEGLFALTFFILFFVWGHLLCLPHLLKLTDAWLQGQQAKSVSLGILMCA